MIKLTLLFGLIPIITLVLLIKQLLRHFKNEDNYGN